MSFLCPVCGFPDLSEAPWTDGGGSDEICVCCGTHFGYDDHAGGDAGRREALWRELRSRWQAEGCPWFSRARPRDTNWDPNLQLEVFRDE